MSCSYAAVGTRKKQSSSSQSSNSPDGMQNRIDRLESLVLSLMTNGAQSPGATAATRALSMTNSTGSMEYPQDVDVDVDGDNQKNGMVKGEGEEAESETDQVSQSLGMMKVDNNKSLYFGDAHWATILSDVSPKSYNSSRTELMSCRLQRSRIFFRNTRSNMMIKCEKSKSPKLAKNLFRGQHFSLVQRKRRITRNYSRLSQRDLLLIN